MKGSVLAVAAAVASGVSGHAHRRHAHEAFHLERGLYASAPAGTAAGTGASGETCGCTTVYYTTTGPATLVHPTTSTSTTTVPPPPATSAPPPLIPPHVTTCSTTGTYSFPATTVTLTETTAVCGASTTSVPSGTHTLGGVTTVVETSTTVVCPYATVHTSGGVETSTVLTTTYVCPESGTYTIAPITTTVSTSGIVVVPTPTSYTPGVYTQPELTTTITEPNFIYVCPLTASGAEATTSSVAPPAANTSIVPPPAANTSAPPPPPPSSSAPAPAATTASSAGKSTSGSSGAGGLLSGLTGGLTGSGSGSGSGGLLSGLLGSLGLGGSQKGKQWAITYTPYDNSGACKSASAVESDIADIASKGFSVVRTYSTDCSTLQNVGTSAKKHGLKMIVGIFISSTVQDAQQQVQEIIEWGLWEIVELVVVGNESIFNGKVSATDLASFITSVTSSFKSSGYKGPVTTTEPLNIWQESSGALCEVVDVVGANLYAYFNADTLPEAAGTFIASQMTILDALCPGKTSINLECGWPSGGDANGKATVGPSEQATAIKSIVEAVGEKTVLFSYQNDDWKDPGPQGVEQHWGLIQLF